MTKTQEDAIHSALNTHCMDIYIVCFGTRKLVGEFTESERHANVPEALAMAELHRVFVNDCLNPKYLETRKVLAERMILSYR